MHVSMEEHQEGFVLNGVFRFTHSLAEYHMTVIMTTHGLPIKGTAQ